MRKLCVLSLALILALAGSVSAQLVPCNIGDDGFNLGGCCQIPQPNLPNFPGIQTSARWGCLNSCSLEADFLVNLNLTPPNFVACDQALIQVNVMPAAPGAPAFSGLLIGKYVRTWGLPSAAGTAGEQVWRFTVNGELVSNPTTVSGGIPCPVPPCVGPNLQGTIHVWGSIDYICQGVTSTGIPNWRIRMDLSHGPGCLQHAPWTTTPLVGAPAHNSRSYHLVAPSTFIWLASNEPQGALLADSARESQLNPFTGAYNCFTEARVLQGQINTVSANCLCQNVTPVIGPWRHQNLNAVVVCGGMTSVVNNLPLPGTPFPTGLTALNLGRYIGAGGTTMGQELTVYWGVLQYNVFCGNNFPVHVVHGVATRGQPGFLFGAGPVAAPMSVFMDFQNHKPLVSLAAGIPGFGSTAIADQVWSFNMP